MEEIILAYLVTAAALILLSLGFFILYIFFLHRGKSKKTLFSILLTSAFLVIQGINFSMHVENGDTSLLIKKIAVVSVSYLLILVCNLLKKSR